MMITIILKNNYDNDAEGSEIDFDSNDDFRHSQHHTINKIKEDNPNKVNPLLY